jgi:hypothetical protein
MPMKSTTTLATSFLALALASSCAPRDEDAAPPSPVKAWLPAGDPAAGRDAFVALQCHACHEVKSDPSVPMLTAVDPGPVLGPPTLGLFSQGELVSAIVVPTHSVMDYGGKPPGGELSRMGDFTEVMTVRQLVDIVSYLQQIGRS